MIYAASWVKSGANTWWKEGRGNLCQDRRNLFLAHLPSLLSCLSSDLYKNGKSRDTVIWWQWGIGSTMLTFGHLQCPDIRQHCCAWIIFQGDQILWQVVFATFTVTWSPHKEKLRQCKRRNSFWSSRKRNLPSSAIHSHLCVRDYQLDY